MRWGGSSEKAAGWTVIHAAVGGISENDITLAEATDSLVVGFNSRPNPKARRAARAAGIEIMTYSVIYELLGEMEQLLVGRLAPVQEERVLGAAEVRAVFRVPRLGAAAGCYVVEGAIPRHARARLLRGGIVLYDGRVVSLRRFKEDVAEVSAGVRMRHRAGQGSATSRKGTSSRPTASTRWRPNDRSYGSGETSAVIRWRPCMRRRSESISGSATSTH